MEFLQKLLGLHKTPRTPTADSEPLPAQVAARFNFGWSTETGMVRRHNEDAVMIFISAHDGDEALPAFGLFVLADGMGGHQAGEVASSLATRMVAHHIIQTLYLPTLVELEHNDEQPALNEMMIAAVQAANKAVTKKAPGAGTTLTCALMLGPRAYIAHVGDSRAYISTENGLRQITHDHSLVDRLIEMGQLTRDEASAHPQKNVLYRAVGQEGELDVDTYVQTVPQDGFLLLCSDGLWGMMPEREISRIIAASPTPQAACEALIAAANQAGGHDNITVILIASQPDWKA